MADKQTGVAMKKSEEILFLSSLGLYSDEINYLINKYDSPIEILESNSLDQGIKLEDKIKKKYGARKNDFQSYREFMEENNISYLTIADQDYPQGLRDIDDPPSIIYINGRLDLSRPAISVVGSRKCTDYGKWACSKLIDGLSQYGISIISGLALGIDRISHERALDNGLYSLGVLGCGVDRVYPASNRGIFERMEASGGIISEFSLGTEPLPHHFPIRNRIISALGKGLLVIEAKEKSGTLITAGYAADQGRDVFALPGNINSQFSKGTNALIRDGAKIVTCVEDIIEEFPKLKIIKEEAEKIQKDKSKLDAHESRIYESLSLEPKSIDDLSRDLDMAMADLMSRLTMLELKGIVVELDGKWNIN